MLQCCILQSTITWDKTSKISPRSLFTSLSYSRESVQSLMCTHSVLSFLSYFKGNESLLWIMRRPPKLALVRFFQCLALTHSLLIPSCFTCFRQFIPMFVQENALERAPVGHHWLLSWLSKPKPVCIYSAICDCWPSRAFNHILEHISTSN